MKLTAEQLNKSRQAMRMERTRLACPIDDGIYASHVSILNCHIGMLLNYSYTLQLEKTLRLIDEEAKTGKYVILFGPSGYINTPMRAEICRYDPTYRPLQPWVNHAGDSFTDGGALPTHYLPLPDMKSID